MAKAIIKAVLLAAALFVSFRYVAAFSLVQSLVLWALALVVCWTVEELLYQPPQLAPFRLRISPNWQALLLDFGPVEGREKYRRPRNPLTVQDEVYETLWESVRDRLRADGEETSGRFCLLRDSIEVTFLKPGLIYWDIYRSFSSEVDFKAPTLTDGTGFHEIYAKSDPLSHEPLSKEWFPVVIGLVGSLKWWEGLSAANSGLAETCPAVFEAALIEGHHFERSPRVETDQIVGTATVPIAIIPLEEFLPYWRTGRARSVRSAMRQAEFVESTRLRIEEARTRYGWEATFDFPTGPVTFIKHKYFTAEHWSI